MSNITAIEQYKVVFLLRKGAYYDVYRVVDAKDGKYFLKLINLAKLDKLQFSGMHILFPTLYQENCCQKTSQGKADALFMT